jgi:hypothetical protein
VIDGSEILTRVCGAVAAGDTAAATSILETNYPFTPLANAGRRYSAAQSLRTFAKDGFIDRYSGRRLVFPGTLRMLSAMFPTLFPFHSNWKTDACHFAFYELFPTVDHLVPVSRGGADAEDNFVTTSMLRKCGKGELHD